ncbi:hypothetical protein TCAL_03817 [Tigriopus californicus]|uniref:Apyrase n=1 Tax=Tigriopus californicus TaxID=6832 RepID=A0A553NUB3_TIGCA|nr:soluble calcium-activated nucleotidase 1-like [Tigriopus californicus]TRY69025.1 hypothetical protein TCAL_03817 [Tigriopus californicus]|eukprot:TCALIF_03817-PA protein Name:"Similar to Cant1 Soluble calcium-activated nucleotidase 1 (Rattus norvegicus)" AED:0.02 eAED:0.02 QI:405/1/0.5/1/1/1/2/0/491
MSGQSPPPTGLRSATHATHSRNSVSASFAAIFAPQDRALQSALPSESRPFLSSEPNLTDDDDADRNGHSNHPPDSGERATLPSTMRHSASASVLEMGGMGEWRRTVHQPWSYRMGNSTFHFQKPLVVAISVILCGLFVLVYWLASSRGQPTPYAPQSPGWGLDHDHPHLGAGLRRYNAQYPLSQPTITPQGLQYQIAVIADPDEASKDPDKSHSWRSYLKTGLLTYETGQSHLLWDASPPIEIRSGMSNGGRGMELSELIVFDGKLLTIDDRTGVIYQMEGEKVMPWVILADGNGSETKSFKGEWLALKDEHLYVGGLGKEWTTPDGTVLNFNPMYVKRISKEGWVEHLNWHDNYVALKKAAGIEFPGYMIHEAAAWSSFHKKWFFLPRRASKNKYNDVEDERHGTNMMFMANEDFSDIQLRHIGTLDEPSHGFSSFKFIPDTDDSVIIALKSQELEGTIATYAMIFRIDGTILMPETKFADIKYEGIEFV